MSLPICIDYRNAESFASNMNMIISNGINILNVFFLFLITSLMSNVGSHTITKVSSHISNTLFLCIFFNTAVIIMISGADFKDQGIPIIDLFTGLYKDFNAKWYFVNGDIVVLNMLINSVVPFVLIILTEVLIRVQIYFDK